MRATLLLLSLLVGTRVLAQPATPTATMRAFLAAIAAGRADEAAGLIDLESYGRWRRANLETARMPRSARRPVTPEEIMRADTLMPRAVAEYQARRINAHQASDTRPWLLGAHADVPTLDSLARLPARAAAARWIRARDPRWLAAEAVAELRRAGCLVDSATASDFATLPDTHAVIGSIERGAVAFVVTQQILRHPAEYGRDQDDRELPPRSVRLRRTPAGWRLLDWEVWFDGAGVRDIMASDCVRGPTKVPE